MKYLRRMVRMSRVLNTCRASIRCTFRLLAWIPVLFVAILLTWGYYVYVYIINISGTFPVVNDSPAVSLFFTVLFLISAHVIFFLQVTSYVRTIFTRHKGIPEQFVLSEDQLEQLDQSVDEQTVLRELASYLPINQLSCGGGVRYCGSCDLLKPDRCHHCSVCNRCVLKMDHHCPWVNNCVGFSNYKFFVLFLLYSVVLCLWLCITGLNAFITAWAKDNQIRSSDKFQVIFWYLICSMFGLSTAVLFCFHLYLTLFNKTTLENMQPPSVTGSDSYKPYFITYKRNMQQVFGSNCFLAFLPIFTSEGNGIVYFIRGITGVGGQISHNDGSSSEIEFVSEMQPLTHTNVVLSS